MPKVERVFLPWGAFAPDLGEFGHDSLTLLENVAPAFGNFYPLPAMKFGSATSANGSFFGLHVHPVGTAYEIYAGTAAKLWEISTSGGTITDRTRLAGGAYAAAGFWSFTSFGNTIFASQYDDALQSVVTGGANFADALTSTFKPRGLFTFPVKGNLFLADCKLPANYDTLTAGSNPYLYCWSATDAPASMGSANVDPQLVGAGFQQITNDLGPLRGAVGGEYGLIFQEKGIIRIDGPPYANRTIAEGYTTSDHYSVVKVDQDVYFWSLSGPAVLRGGDGPAVFLGQGAVARALLDGFSGFTADPLYVDDVPNGFDGLSGAYLPRISSVVFLGRLRGESSNAVESLCVQYNIKEDRFSFWRPSRDANGGASWLRPRPQNLVVGGQVDFLPTAGLVAVGDDEIAASSYAPTKLATFEFGQSAASLPHRFGRGFEQLDANRLTRVLRMRPVHRLSPDASALTLTVTVDDVNTPSGTPVTATAEVPDAEGWCAFGGSLETAFHRPRVTYQFADDASPNLMEAQGVELEYMLGAEYGT